MKVKRARKDSRMSQKELGDALGVSDKAISSYEQGRAFPPLKTIQKLAKITRKPISYFTGNDENEVEYSVASLLMNVEREFKEIKELLGKK
ncbi:helix-turn-helix transcriptional regulator [Patescibacteria group bacterium]|nr:helix-turn-helix transcriptional regulator [Patescibacteria group bacterium]